MRPSSGRLPFVAQPPFRRNYGGLIVYVLAFALVMQPISVWGYASELLRQRKGWEYRVQAGYGAQHASRSGWSDSRYADLLAVSPRTADGWEVRAEVTYSNTSPASGPNYDYVSGRFALARAF